jgi:hypothetical protein
MNRFTEATRCVLRAKRDGLKTPPRLSLSEWANEFAYLSLETCAEPGWPEANGEPVCARIAAA